MRTGTGDTAVSDVSDRVTQLRSEHAELDKRLEELNSNVYLTSEETLEVAKLKREKLVKKDQIHQITAENQA